MGDNLAGQGGQHIGRAGQILGEIGVRRVRVRIKAAVAIGAGQAGLHDQVVGDLQAVLHIEELVQILAFRLEVGKHHQVAVEFAVVVQPFLQPLDFLGGEVLGGPHDKAGHRVRVNLLRGGQIQLFKLIAVGFINGFQGADGILILFVPHESSDHLHRVPHHVLDTGGQGHLHLGGHGLRLGIAVAADFVHVVEGRLLIAIPAQQEDIAGGNLVLIVLGSQLRVQVEILVFDRHLAAGIGRILLERLVDFLVQRLHLVIIGAHVGVLVQVLRSEDDNLHVLVDAFGNFHAVVRQGEQLVLRQIDIDGEPVGQQADHHVEHHHQHRYHGGDCRRHAAIAEAAAVHFGFFRLFAFGLAVLLGRFLFGGVLAQEFLQGLLLRLRGILRVLSRAGFLGGFALAGRLAVGRGLLVGGQQALFVQCLQQFVFQLAVAGRILKSVILYHVGIPPLSSISCDPEPERSGTQTALVNSRKRPHCRS